MLAVGIDDILEKHAKIHYHISISLTKLMRGQYFPQKLRAPKSL